MDFSSFFSDVSAGIVVMVITLIVGGVAGGTLFRINKNKKVVRYKQKISQRGGEGNSASIQNINEK